MKPGRNQYTLGSLMMLIAILAIGFTFPERFATLLLGGIASFFIIVVPAFLYHVITHWHAPSGRDT
jgi:hypothetical protein